MNLIKVLLVEDNPVEVFMVRAALERYSSATFKVDSADRLAVAIERTSAVPIDVVLLDLGLPDTQGLATFAGARAAFPNTPILVLSGLDDEQVAIQSVQQGAQDYLLKGITMEEVLPRAIRYAIERHRAQEQLQRATEGLRAKEAELARSERLACLGMLAAGVAHEVKNPLQTIIMGLDYLRDKVPAPNETIGLTMSDMRDAVNRADAIIRELLQLSAATEFEPKAGDLNAVIERSLWLVNNQVMASRVKVARNLAADLPMVPIDRGKMEQVFINLFINAIQAMSQGGTLSVATCAARLDEELLSRQPVFRRFKPGQAVVLAHVQDTGTGIPEADLPRIPTPFFTTKPVGKGCGLGLAVAKNIMDLHGGAIDIRNAPHGGVLVTLALKVE